MENNYTEFHNLNNLNNLDNSDDSNGSNDSNDYNPYVGQEPSVQRQEHSVGGNAKQRDHHKGFGITLAKCVAIALVFGLVAGATFTAVSYLGGNALGVFADTDNTVNKPNSNKNDNSGFGNGNNHDITQNTEGVLDKTNTDAEITVSVMDVSDLVTNVMPCVVAITNTTETKYQSLWGESYTKESTSAGSGFIVDQDEKYIYIATNNHVVDKAKELEVQFFDESTAQAEIKGTVATKDLAVIKVDIEDISGDTLSNIRLATLGKSNELKVGEAAIAIGNALGYGQSVTTGTISALGRSVTVSDATTGSSIVCSNLIQTDAAINPGNSGGALLNAKGEIIGINSVKYSETSVEGIGYAIPISDAMIVIEKLIRGEKIEAASTGYLGIQGSDTAEGVIIRKVFSGSAAEQAGLCVGDIIVGFEGNSIATMSQLKELLSYYPAGEEVEFTILHAQGNEYVEKEITVVLGDASSIQQ